MRKATGVFPMKSDLIGTYFAGCVYASMPIAEYLRAASAASWERRSATHSSSKLLEDILISMPWNQREKDRSMDHGRFAVHGDLASKRRRMEGRALSIAMVKNQLMRRSLHKHWELRWIAFTYHA